MKEVKEVTINLLSIISFGFAFAAPFAGLILSVISLIQIKGENKGNYKFAKNMSLAALVISAVLLVFQIALVVYTMVQQGGSLFPGL